MTNIKGVNLIASLLLGAGLTLSGYSAAGQETMLELLKVLRDNGSLSNQEYDLLMKAAAQDQPTVSEIAVAPKTNDKTSWTESVKLKGDLRLRYQHQSEDGSVDRDRGRIRYRLGIEAKPSEGWIVGAGLASGGSDLRSTNQSFDSSFSTKGINLDYAYAQYSFNDQLKVIGGKFKRKAYLWQTTDLVWDGDINPEGVSASYIHSSDLGTTFANAGLWILEENSSSEEDAKLAYLQIGQKMSDGDVFGTVAGTYYGYSEINALGDIATEGSNTDYEFDAISISAEVGLKNAFGEGSKASLIADWINNIDTNTSEDSGFAFGIKLAKGPWSGKYIYADLETNAVPDIFPDSDRFDGLTGIDGHEIAVNYKLQKNVTLGLDYYTTDRGDINQDLLQLDLVVKY